MMIVIIVRNTINQSNNRSCMTWLSSSMRQFAPSSLLEPSSLTRSENECGRPRPNPHLPPFLYPLLQFDHPQPFLLYVFLLQKMSLISFEFKFSPPKNAQLAWFERRVQPYLYLSVFHIGRFWIKHLILHASSNDYLSLSNISLTW